jgi:EF hand
MQGRCCGDISTGYGPDFDAAETMRGEVPNRSSRDLKEVQSMKRFILVAVIGIFAFGPGVAPAHAAKGEKKVASKVFNKRDKDGDGSLSLDEMRGKGKRDASKVEKRFKKLDKNSDGKVSLAELSARGKKKTK